jgi:hypothetical protein
MKIFFAFEADFVDSLRCIPMVVRYKLDTCGIKLKLSDWSQMSQDERQTLANLPCSTETEIQAYRQHVQRQILQRTGKPADELPVEVHPTWMDATTIPEQLKQKVVELGMTITQQQWAALTPLERFVLIKLSRSGHENQNFPKAMKEFNLV